MNADEFQERLDRVQQRIREACARANRDESDVQLIAVSKTHGPEVIRVAADCGVTVLGESKVQEARAKIPMSPGHLSWHLIGHLQTNKIRHAVQLFDTIHSVDSQRLMEALDQGCAQVGVTMPIYLEVNVSGERSKYGVEPDDLPTVLEAAAGCTHLDILGLMTIPPFAPEADKARPFFASLRELRERCRGEWGFPFDGLSMGMSHDFEVAIEEGATCVRVGSALFGDRRAKMG